APPTSGPVPGGAAQRRVEATNRAMRAAARSRSALPISSPSSDWRYQYVSAAVQMPALSAGAVHLIGDATPSESRVASVAATEGEGDRSCSSGSSDASIAR